MKKIIIITALLFLPLGVFAKDNWELKESKNTLYLEGACSGHEVRVDLFQGNDSKPIYTSGAFCKDGKFEFFDNLLEWESLRDGEYALVVNDDKQNTKSVSLKRPVKEAVSPTANTGASSPDIESFTSPKTRFFSAFVVFQQSILDMQVWLSETNYPTLAKESIGIALDGLDMTVSKFSDLVLDSESAATANSATENSPSLEFSAN